MEGVEFLLFIGEDDEVGGSESMAKGVLRDAGFAFGSARSGGGLRVELIGSELGGGGHVNFLSVMTFSMATRAWRGGKLRGGAEKKG